MSNTLSDKDKAFWDNASIDKRLDILLRGGYFDHLSKEIINDLGFDGGACGGFRASPETKGHLDFMKALTCQQIFAGAGINLAEFFKSAFEKTLGDYLQKHQQDSWREGVKGIEKAVDVGLVI